MIKKYVLMLLLVIPFGTCYSMEQSQDAFNQAIAQTATYAEALKNVQDLAGLSQYAQLVTSPRFIDSLINELSSKFGMDPKEIARDLTTQGTSSWFIQIRPDQLALLQAARQADVNTVKRLIALGVNVNARSSYGSTALMYASKKGSTELVHMLIGSGANVNARDTLGFTSLMDAAQGCHTPIASLLISAGANSALVNKYGSTALTYALKKDCADIVGALMAQGVSQMVTLRSADEQTLRVSEEVAHMLGSIRHYIQEFGTQEVIPLPTIQGATLSTLVTGLNKLVGLESIAQKLKLTPEQAGTDHYITKEVKQRIASEVKDKSTSELIELLLAANYLDVPLGFVNGYAYFVAHALYNDPQFKKFFADVYLHNNLLQDVPESKKALAAYVLSINYTLPAEMLKYVFKHLVLLERGKGEYSVADYLAKNGKTDMPLYRGELDLGNQGLTSLYGIQFIGHAQDITRLVLWQNALLSSDIDTDFPEYGLDRFSNITQLYLSSNALTSLPVPVFSALTRLEGLYLSGNYLKELPSGIFGTLKRLIMLDLSHNLLSELSEGIFDGLGGLQELDLIDNRLKTLPVSLFRGLTELRRLYLLGNQLSALPDGIFNPCTWLQWLYLSNNRLRALPQNIFGNINLTNLSLNGNYFQESAAEFKQSHVVRTEAFIYNPQLQ